jgi:hypothetical protein
MRPSRDDEYTAARRIRAAHQTVATSLFDDGMRGAEYTGAFTDESPNLKIVRRGKFQVMTETVGNFHVMAEKNFI